MIGLNLVFFAAFSSTLVAFTNAFKHGISANIAPIKQSSTVLNSITIPQASQLQVGENIFVPNISDLKKEDPLQLNKIRNALPAAVFNKSLRKSLFYMIFDFSMWFGSTIAIKSLLQSAVWIKIPILLKAASLLAYWNVAGFFMWCIFVVGHDCGHTTFSNFKWLNDIIGHITHGSLLVPFYPWQLSHRRHHMFHNHLDKDYSYIWYTEETLAQPGEKMAKFLHETPVLSFLYPFMGWQLYLLGINDGSHFLPSDTGRMWRESPSVEKKKGLISAAVAIINLAGIFAVNGFNWVNFGVFYFAPHVVFSWWLFCVTYLQHHGPKTVAYSDKDWSYVHAAFETVDRTFGKGIDHLHHHISDCHVVHHIFFTQIPHYNLPAATAGLKKYLADNNILSLYRHEQTQDFPARLHKYMTSVGFKVTKYFRPESVTIVE